MRVEVDWIGSTMCWNVGGDERENMGDWGKVKKLQSQNWKNSILALKE